jgi:hypothetical protein
MKPLHLAPFLALIVGHHSLVTPIDWKLMKIR